MTVNNKAVTGGIPFIHVFAGRDIVLGNGVGFDNDIIGSGDALLDAGRDLVIDGITNVTGTVTFGFATRDITLGNAFGTGASLGATGASGGELDVTSRTGTVTLMPSVSLFSNLSDVHVSTDRLVIAPSASISAAGFVLFAPIGRPIDLGSTTDAAAALEISDAEVDTVTAPRLIIYGFGSTITVTQPVSRASNELELLTSVDFLQSGTGSVSSPTLTFTDVGSLPRTWTIDATAVTASGGLPVPYSGVTTLNANGAGNNDTFNVTPSPTTTINIDGNLPTPPASPGDTLNVDTTGTTNPLVTTSSTPNGLQGGYTFSNRAPVNFQEIETLTPSSVDLTINKSDAVPSEVPGTLILYTIVVFNPGTLGAGGATVTDNFPPTLTNITWTCIASAGSTCSPGGSGNINDTVTVAGGGTLTYNVQATIAPSATGTLDNTASIIMPPGITDPVPANNSSLDSDTLVPQADLNVGKSDAPDPVIAGNNLTYTITLQNLGPSDASTVSLSDSLPAGTTFVSLAPAAGYSCSTPSVGSNGTVTCTRATLPPSGVADTFTLVVHVAPSATNLTNTATATTTTTDPTVPNNATATTTVATSADVSIAKTANQPTVSPGSTITYTITLANAGPSDASTVSFTDTLPVGTTFNSLTPAGGYSCTTPPVGSGGVVNCSRATVPAGANDVFTLVLNVPANTLPGPLANTVTVTSATADPDPSDNTTTAAAVVENAIPTLSPVMLVLLAAALGIAAVFVTRRA